MVTIGQWLVKSTHRTDRDARRDNIPPLPSESVCPWRGDAPEKGAPAPSVGVLSAAAQSFLRPIAGPSRAISPSTTSAIRSRGIPRSWRRESDIRMSWPMAWRRCWIRRTAARRWATHPSHVWTPSGREPLRGGSPRKPVLNRNSLVIMLSFLL